MISKLTCKRCGEKFKKADSRFNEFCSRKCYRYWKYHNDSEHKRKILNNIHKYNASDKGKRYYADRYKRRNQRENCKAIYNHEKEMKDDPEALTTEFIETMVGVSCKRLKKEKKRETEE